MRVFWEPVTKVVVGAVLFLLLFTSVGIAGKKKKFVIEVNGYAVSGVALNGTFAIIPGDKGLDADSLEFREVARLVESALVKKGMKVVTDPTNARVVILVSYGISAPQEHVKTFTVPVIEKVPGKVEKTGHTTYVTSDQYKETGVTTSMKTYTTYTRHLEVSANKVTGPSADSSREIWKTEATSTGTSGDLRRVIKVLVASVEPFLGKDTGQNVTVKAIEKNGKIKLKY